MSPRDGLVRRKRSENRLIGAALHPLTTRVELDLPLGQLGREAHILAIAADRQRELVLVHNRLNGFCRRIAEHPGHSRGSERQLGEALRIGGPRDDVDSLTTELVDDSLNSRTLEADASSHRIDRVVARKYGD